MRNGQASIESFKATVCAYGHDFYRDLPWRNTFNPYEVLVSEVMLQQTQVARVIDYWQRWLDRFPTIDALAAASTDIVLASWQGLGYNRRALALKKAAEFCSEHHAGALPQDKDELMALPGIGPATSAGVRIFAYGLFDVYLETNVRAVFIHEFFPDFQNVSDRDIYPLVEQTCDRDDPRSWYYALLDYGAYLKKTQVNPSRRSRHHSRQSAFEGSHRQKRAWLLREVMACGPVGVDDLSARLSAVEQAAGREAVSIETVEQILAALASEGFLESEDAGWIVAP